MKALATVLLATLISGPPMPPGMTVKPMVVPVTGAPSGYARAWVEMVTLDDGSQVKAVHMQWLNLTNACYRVDRSLDLQTWKTVNMAISDASGPVTNSLDVLDATVGLFSAHYFRIVPVDTNGVPVL